MFKSLDGCEPEVKTELSVGIDLKSAKNYLVYPGETIVIDLGVKLDLDALRNQWDTQTDQNKDRPTWKQFLKSHFVQLAPRSSLRAKGIISGQGYIDLDLPDSLKLIVHNFSKELLAVHKGERVAQAIVLEHKSFLSGLMSNNKRSGGTGSTDANDNN